MCEPVSTTLAIATAAVDVGSAIVGADAQNKQHRAVVKAANAADTLDQNQISTREAQEQQAARHDIGLADDQAMSSEALARLSAMEAGVKGNSANAVVGNIEAGRSRYVTSVNENLDLTTQQLEEQRLGADAERQARISGAPGASPFAEGLTIAGAGIKLFSTLNGRKP